MQVILSHGKSPYYNYGPELNKRIYNRATPPEYDVPGIKIPIHIIYGEEDWLAPYGVSVTFLIAFVLEIEISKLFEYYECELE